MTKQEFYDKLEKFDWYYFYSDSNRVVNEGERKFSSLRSEAKENGLIALFNEYFDWIHSKLDNNGKKINVKPTRPV